MALPQLTLADLIRSGHVTRWHSVRTLRDPTLAEHHYIVMRLSMKLAKKIIGPSLTDTSLLQIIEYASLHDSQEIILGDSPSPARAHIRKICKEKGIPNPIDQIEHEVAPWLTDMKNEMKENNPEFLNIIKLADIIDALVFISVEGIGTHAKSVIVLLKKMLSEKLQESISGYPQYDWQYTMELVNELMEQDEKTQIAFEKRD